MSTHRTSCPLNKPYLYEKDELYCICDDDLEETDDDD